MGVGSKTLSVWPAALRSVQTANVAPADAELAQTIAGRSRWLYEMATGGPATVADPPGVPNNPQGLVGHDHSGPPYGSAPKHRLFGWSGALVDVPDTWTASVGAYELSPGNTRRSLRNRVWVRPFVSFVGAPYSVADVIFRAVSTGGSQDVTVEVSTNGGAVSSEVLTVTTTPAGFVINDCLDLVPGFNTVQIDFDTAPSGAAHPVYITSFGAMQTAKRSH